MVGNPGLHLLPQHPEQWPCEGGSPSRVGAVPPGPVQLGSPWNSRTACCAQSTARCAQSTCRNHKLLEQLQGASGTGHKCRPCAPARLPGATQVTPGHNVAQSQLVYFGSPLPPPTPGHEALRKEQCALPAHALPFSGNQESSPSVLPAQELLRKLQAVHQEQQLQAVPRPSLAARFPVSAQGSGTEKPLEGWASKTANVEKQAPLLQVSMYWEIAAIVMQWALLCCREREPHGFPSRTATHSLSVCLFVFHLAILPGKRIFSLLPVWCPLPFRGGCKVQSLPCYES